MVGALLGDGEIGLVCVCVCGSSAYRLWLKPQQVTLMEAVVEAEESVGHRFRQHHIEDTDGRQRRVAQWWKKSQHGPASLADSQGALGEQAHRWEI